MDGDAFDLDHMALVLIICRWRWSAQHAAAPAAVSAAETHERHAAVLKDHAHAEGAASYHARCFRDSCGTSSCKSLPPPSFLMMR